jgi:hypothetical protein
MKIIDIRIECPDDVFEEACNVADRAAAYVNESFNDDQDVRVETFDASEELILVPGDCHWCGRSDNEGVITDDLGDRYYYCHRHKAEVASMIEDTLTEEEP